MIELRRVAVVALLLAGGCQGVKPPVQVSGAGELRPAAVVATPVEAVAVPAAVKVEPVVASPVVAAGPVAAGGLAPLSAEQRALLLAGGEERMFSKREHFTVSNEYRHDLWFPYLRGLGGVYVDGGMYSFGDPTLPGTGRAGTLGSMGTFHGRLTVDPGGEISGPGLRFEGEVFNNGSIASTGPLGTVDRSILFDGASYQGAGALTSTSVTVRGASVFSANDAPVQIEFLNLLEGAQANLAAVDVQYVTTYGTLVLGGRLQSTLRHVTAHGPCSIRLDDGALVTPATLDIVRAVVIGVSGTLRTDSLVVEPIPTNGGAAFRRGDAATALVAALGAPAGSSASSGASVASAAGLVTATVPRAGVSSVRALRAAAAAPTVAAPAAVAANLPGDPDGLLTLTDQVVVQVPETGSASVRGGADVALFGTATLELDGVFEYDTDVVPLHAVFGAVHPGQTLRLGGCINVFGSDGWTDGQSILVAEVRGGTVTNDARVVANRAPFIGGRWRLDQIGRASCRERV